MNKKDVLAHFGGVVKAAKALNRTKGAVSQWPEILPFEIQCFIEVKTGGALKADREPGTDAA